MYLKRSKAGTYTCRLSDFPNEDELRKLNALSASTEYYMCEDRGYKRLLVRTYGSDVLPTVMECPINETFRN